MDTPREQVPEEVEKIEEKSERSIDDIVAQTDIEVMLGGKQRLVPIVSYIKAKKWREKWKAFQEKYCAESEADENETPTIATLEKVFNSVEMLDGLIELMFVYWLLSEGFTEASKIEIEETASEQELQLASRKVVRAVSPLALTTAIGKSMS